MTGRRLIEEIFPLKKVSANSRHEKNVRHGHISTLHIWPARRLLAACRAAIIAALLPDPGDEASRHSLNKKIESIRRDDQTTAQAMTEILADSRGYPIPWALLGEGINEELRLHLFERVPEGEPWPCSPAVAAHRAGVGVHVPRHAQRGGAAA